MKSSELEKAARTPRDWAVIFALAAVYFFSGKLGLSLAFIDESASAVWPPTGIALAAVLLFGRRVWPGILLGAFLVNLGIDGSIPISLGIAIGNTLEAVVGFTLLHRFAGGRQAFDRPQNIFKFVVLGMLSTAVSATWGVTTLSVGGLAAWNDFGPIWLTWWLGDMVSLLTVAPPLLLWGGRPLPRLNARSLLEGSLLTGAVFLVGQAVFGGWFPSKVKSYPLEFLCIPFLVWSAFRLGPRATATVAFETAVIATWGTLNGFGPFVMEEPNQSLLLLQTFLGTITITGMVLASVVSERKKAEETLQLESTFRRAIEGSIPAGIVVADLQGKQTYVNPAFCALVGWREEELVNRLPPYVYWPPEEMDLIVNAFTKMIRGEAPAGGFELTFRRRNEDRFTAQILLSPLKDSRGIQRGWVASVSDITGRKKGEDERARLLLQVENQQQRIGNLLATVPGIVWEAWGRPDQSSQRIDFVSRHVEVMLGYTIEEWLATPNFWLTIVHPDDRERAGREAASIFAECKGGVSQFRWMAKDGRAIWVESQSVVVCDDRGVPIGMRGVTMDITARKEVEEELRKKTIEAQNASRIKSQFVSNVSHELRTPLNGVIGYSHLLLDGTYGPLTEGQKSPLEGVLRNADDLLYLINNLLDFSKIESGRMSLNPEMVNLPLLLEEILTGIRPMIEKKALSIRWNVDPALPPIESDIKKIKQILVNLLSNAVKFTHEGEIVLEMRNAPARRRVEIRIQDTGIGIQPEELPKIFDPFHQVDSSVTREFGGTGLGLTIVKELVQILKGEIQVESRSGEGSTFSLFLPYRIEQPADRP